jgi:choline-sulfatase
MSTLERTLRSIFDPEAIDRLAHDDQAALVARHGGRVAVLDRGSFSGTPIPGETAEFISSN